MNHRGFTGKRYNIKDMQGLGPILLTPSADTWSCDISVLHTQIHGLCETTASGHTRMVLQARLAPREAFEATFLCDLREASLCFIKCVSNGCEPTKTPQCLRLLQGCTTAVQL